MIPSRSGKRAGVLILFPLCALAALALSSLSRSAETIGPRESILDFASTGQMLLHNPSVYFSGAMIVAGYLALNLGWVPGGMTFRGVRVALGAFIAAVIYPVALASMMAVALPLMSRPGSRDSFEEPAALPAWREFLIALAPYLALVVGGFVVVFLLALAFRVATAQRPELVWLWALVVTLGAPLLTLLFAYGQFFVLGARGARGATWSSVLDLLLEPMMFRVPVFFLIGELLLALNAAWWFYTAAAGAASDAA